MVALKKEVNLYASPPFYLSVSEILARDSILFKDIL